MGEGADARRVVDRLAARIGALETDNAVLAVRLETALKRVGELEAQLNAAAQEGEHE